MRISKISVLIACYQSELYIEQALQSIIDNINYLETDSKCNSKKDSENIKNLEVQILIIDDGSTDKTEQIIKNFIERSKEERANKLVNVEFTYVKQKNQGQAKALENSLMHIKGNLVLLLDSDDKFLEHKINTVLQALEDNPDCVMVTHPQFVIDSKGKRTGKMHPELAKLSSGDIRKVAKGTGRIIAPATTGLCFKKETFIKIHPSPATQYQPYDLPDLYLALAASLEGPILAIETPLSEYRRHAGGKFFDILSTEEGLRTFLNFQKNLEERLSISPRPYSNSFVARLKFAADKMSSQERATAETPLKALESLKSLKFLKTLKNLKNLVRSTLNEKNFNPHHKLMMCTLWIGLAALPKGLFKKAWTKLIKKQTNS